jgi:hypothetical protein
MNNFLAKMIIPNSIRKAWEDISVDVSSVQKVYSDALRDLSIKKRKIDSLVQLKEPTYTSLRTLQGQDLEDNNEELNSEELINNFWGSISTQDCLKMYQEVLEICEKDLNFKKILLEEIDNDNQAFSFITLSATGQKELNDENYNKLKNSFFALVANPESKSGYDEKLHSFAPKALEKFGKRILALLKSDNDTDDTEKNKGMRLIAHLMPKATFCANGIFSELNKHLTFIPIENENPYFVALEKMYEVRKEEFQQATLPLLNQESLISSDVDRFNEYLSNPLNLFPIGCSKAHPASKHQAAYANVHLSQNTERSILFIKQIRFQNDQQLMLATYGSMYVFAKQLTSSESLKSFFSESFYNYYPKNNEPFSSSREKTLRSWADFVNQQLGGQFMSFSTTTMLENRFASDNKSDPLQTAENNLETLQQNYNQCQPVSFLNWLSPFTYLKRRKLAGEIKKAKDTLEKEKAVLQEYNTMKQSVNSAIAFRLVNETQQEVLDDLQTKFPITDNAKKCIENYISDIGDHIVQEVDSLQTAVPFDEKMFKHLLLLSGSFDYCDSELSSLNPDLAQYALLEKGLLSFSSENKMAVEKAHEYVKDFDAVREESAKMKAVERKIQSASRTIQQSWKAYKARKSA